MALFIVSKVTQARAITARNWPAIKLPDSAIGLTPPATLLAAGNAPEIDTTLADFVAAKSGRQHEA
jgi:hypothetical protein